MTSMTEPTLAAPLAAALCHAGVGCDWNAGRRPMHDGDHRADADEIVAKLRVNPRTVTALVEALYDSGNPDGTLNAIRVLDKLLGPV